MEDLHRVRVEGALRARVRDPHEVLLARPWSLVVPRVPRGYTTRGSAPSISRRACRARHSNPDCAMRCSPGGHSTAGARRRAPDALTPLLMVGWRVWMAIAGLAGACEGGSGRADRTVGLIGVAPTAGRTGDCPTGESSARSGPWARRAGRRCSTTPSRASTAGCHRGAGTTIPRASSRWMAERCTCSASRPPTRSRTSATSRRSPTSGNYRARVEQKWGTEHLRAEEEPASRQRVALPPDVARTRSGRSASSSRSWSTTSGTSGCSPAPACSRRWTTRRRASPPFDPLGHAEGVPATGGSSSRPMPSR